MALSERILQVSFRQNILGFNHGHLSDTVAACGSVVQCINHDNDDAVIVKRNPLTETVEYAIFPLHLQGVAQYLDQFTFHEVDCSGWTEISISMNYNPSYSENLEIFT